MGKFGKQHRPHKLKTLMIATACAAATITALPTLASASTQTGLTNAGFESGTTSGWSGNGVATSSYEGYTAPDGRYFAVVLGGCHTNTLAQSFTANAGQTLTGWSFFKANDYAPFNDSGSVQLSVTGAGGSTTVFASSINQVGSYGGTPWRQWSYTAPADGTYTIQVSSTNDLDCAVPSAVGLDLRADTTPPAITASATSNGASYTAGTWTNHDVTVHFTCTDEPGGSGVASVTPDQTVSTEGDGQSVTGSCTDNAGNTASTTFTGIRIDTTAPAVTASATSNSAPYTAGTWTNHDVTVHFTCTDNAGGSGAASVTPDQTLSTDGDGQSATGTCTDNAGNTASTTFTGIRIDTTAPTVTYSGNAGTYSVDQQVAITCTASDALSGVASSTCANATGPAYTFGLGSHTLTASAVDSAGNQASATTTFTVQVNYSSLCNLATQFSTSTDVATGLCDKLTAASQAAARGQNVPKANILRAFDQQVAAQTGKALTAKQAAVLTSLAAAL